jgi:Domain of unknown function (DUF4202)
MDDEARFERAIAAIDAANADDPHDKELRQAELATKWVRRLRPDASEALLLAARGHHIRRWTIGRDTYPEGRRGYLRWRRDLQRQHAADLDRILTAEGYDETTVSRVQDIVQKRQLTTDPEVQAFEDALCLVFAEDQLADFATRVDKDKLDDIIEKTKEKMSPEGRRLLGEVTDPGTPPDAPSR